MSSAPGEPKSLVTIDLSSAAPRSRFTRAVVGVLLALVFGVIALACAVLYFGYAFIPAVAEWDIVIEWVAPVLGVLSFGLALLGLEFVRRSRKNATQEPTVFDTAIAAVDAIDPDGTDVGPLSASSPQAPKGPTIL